jgi:hypothetical protein
LARIDADEDDATLVCSHLVPRHHVVPSFYLDSPFPFCHLVYEKKKDEEEELALLPLAPWMQLNRLHKPIDEALVVVQ